MILCFELSMPQNNSWNGKWSGGGRYYAIVRNLGKTKKAIEKAKSILKTKTYYHHFGDGWVAGIQAREVDANEAAKCRRKSKGFWGYNWMVDSIIRDGEIIAPSDRKGA